MQNCHSLSGQKPSNALPELRKKLDPKSEKCIFVGYPDGTKGFKLYNIQTKKFVRSRSVVFWEERFNDFDSNVTENEYIFPSSRTMMKMKQWTKTKKKLQTMMVYRTTKNKPTTMMI